MANLDRPTDPADRDAFSPFVKRMFFVLLAAGLALMAWSLAGLLLAVFAGLLLSVLLRNLSTRVADTLRIGKGVALWLVVFLIIAVTALALSLFGAQLAGQFQGLIEALPVALERIWDEIEESWLVQFALEQAEDNDLLSIIGQGLVGPVADAASAVVEAVVGFLVILLIGLLLSISPALYREGIVRLAPVPHRARTRDILIETDTILWKWLVGQMIAMVFVGAITTAGLLLLGAPMAVALGLLTGLLNFVPVVGPIIAAVPAILVAFVEGPMLALYVLLLYIVVQQLESLVIMPVAQRWAVSLPPVLALVSAIAAGMLFGLGGVMLAVPLVVMVMGLVRMIYVETLLEGKGSNGDRPEQDAAGSGGEDAPAPAQPVEPA